MNILFTCSGRRNYLLNYFKNELPEGSKIIASDMQMSAPSMADADIAVVAKSIYHPEYVQDIIETCNKYNVDAVISLNDLELPILASHKNDIEANSEAKVIVPSEAVIDICFDKIKTVEFAKRLNIRTPLTFLSAESFRSANSAGEIEFPVVVKPRWGSASIGLEFPQEMREFELSYEMINLKLDRTILGKVSAVDRDSAIMIQQKIAGKEYGLDIVNDLEGNHVGVIVKEKLSMRSGETDKAVTVNNSEISAIGKLIGENLGHVGNLDCDIMEENGQYYLIEMNPRFGGGYPFSHEAGANVPKAILSWLEGAKSSDEFLKVSFNSAFSKCDRLVGITSE